MNQTQLPGHQQKGMHLRIIIAVWVQSESNSFIPSGFIIHPIIRSSCAISLDAIEKGPDIAPRTGIVLPHLSTAIFAASAQFPGLPIFVMQKLIGFTAVCKLLFVSIPQ